MCLQTNMYLGVSDLVGALELVFLFPFSWEFHPS